MQIKHVDKLNSKGKMEKLNKKERGTKGKVEVQKQGRKDGRRKTWGTTKKEMT